MMDLVSRIAPIKADMQRAAADLLNTLAFVPDDRMAWSPSESARSALWIVGHCGEANRAFSRGLRGETMGAPIAPEEFGRMIYLAGRDTRTREEAVRAIEETTQDLLAALDDLTEARLAGSVEGPFGTLPMELWITFPNLHMTGHARQIDYLQTVWGDLQDHMAA
jgi:hypothetical protein